jgi:hypothetical protein
MTPRSSLPFAATARPVHLSARRGDDQVLQALSTVVVHDRGGADGAARTHSPAVLVGLTVAWLLG